ncbi:MAG: alpha-L-fucosidase [Bacteroidales bacterium]|nr:alpha-L-fucosidase [Bacteroidales bacterium]
MNARTIILALAAAAVASACKNAPAPEPYGAIPSPQQVEWQKMEMNMFAHFGPNTFTGREWGLGTEAEDIFNPTDLDCGQWASIAKTAGFKGIIITGKHHDGFCLWPNPMSTHTVASSPWKDGKGDVLKELSEACAGEGLKFGVYVSPWDRNDPHYGTPEYNDVYVKTLESVHDGRYGEVFEQWFDGANGEGPNGKKQVYDWPLFHQTVLKYSPDAIMFSDVGPGCRWVGNESGVAGRTNWSFLDIEGFTPGAGAPPTDTLNCGNVHGHSWIPAETDVSIRPGWFWRESENDKVKSVDKLLGIYYTSVGRNSLLLLNVPPDTTGRIHPADSARLLEFKDALDRIFKEDLAEGAKATASSSRGRNYKAQNILNGGYDAFWAAPDGVCDATLTFNLNGKKTFNRVMLQEYIPLGQRVSSFTVEAMTEDDSWKTIAEETTIGYKRIVLTEKVTTDKVRVTVKAYAPPVLNGFGLFMDTTCTVRP